MRVERVSTNKYIPLLSFVSNLFTSWHCLLKSQSIVHGHLLSTHLGTVSSIQLWNQNSLSFGAWSQDGVDYIFVSPFHSTITRVVVRGLKNSSVAVAHGGYLVQSHRPLRGSVPHKLIALSSTH